MKRTLSVMLLATVIPFAFAGKVIGQITFLTGKVTLVRNGEPLPMAQLKIGTPIEDFDLIRTGPNGKLDLIIRTPQNQQIQLAIQSNTVFSIETNKLTANTSRTTFEMMSGTLSCKVDKLAGNEVQVKTKSAAMGVKGTNFKVSTVASDDILVTCDEGRVLCRDEEGKEYYAEPGFAVESLSEEQQFQQIKITDGDLETFRLKWVSQRLNVFKANAARVLFQFSSLFQKYYNELVTIYNELKKKRGIFDKWMDEDRHGEIAPLADLIKEKRAVAGLLLRAKGKLYMFDRIYFRILEIESYYNEGIGRETYRSFSPQKFFADLATKKFQIENMIYVIRYLFKLFAIRNEGYFPVDTEVGDEEYEDFFD